MHLAQFRNKHHGNTLFSIQGQHRKADVVKKIPIREEIKYKTRSNVKKRSCNQVCHGGAKTREKVRNQQQENKYFRCLVDSLKLVSVHARYLVEAVSRLQQKYSNASVNHRKLKRSYQCTGKDNGITPKSYPPRWKNKSAIYQSD